MYALGFAIVTLSLRQQKQALSWRRIILPLFAMHKNLNKPFAWWYRTRCSADHFLYEDVKPFYEYSTVCSSVYKFDDDLSEASESIRQWHTCFPAGNSEVTWQVESPITSRATFQVLIASFQKSQAQHKVFSLPSYQADMLQRAVQ